MSSSLLLRLLVCALLVLNVCADVSSSSGSSPVVVSSTGAAPPTPRIQLFLSSNYTYEGDSYIFVNVGREGGSLCTLVSNFSIRYSIDTAIDPSLDDYLDVFSYVTLFPESTDCSGTPAATQISNRDLVFDQPGTIDGFISDDSGSVL